MNGKRRVSRKKAEELAKAFGLDPLERMQFLSHFPDLSTRPTTLKYSAVDEATFEVIRGWVHFAILSLMRTDAFKSDPVWIAKRLGTEPQQVQECLDRLIECGLIQKTPDGALLRTSSAIRTSDDRASQAIRLAHEETNQLAIRSLNRDPVSSRDISSITLSIDRSRLPQAKEAIRRFQDELSELLEVGKKTEVYRLSVQLFPLTQIEPESTQ